MNVIVTLKANTAGQRKSMQMQKAVALQKTDGYLLHVGSPDQYNAFSFQEDTAHFIAVVKNPAGDVHVFVNGSKISDNPI